MAWSIPIASFLAIGLALHARENRKERIAVRHAVTENLRDGGTVYEAPKLETRYSAPHSVSDWAKGNLMAYYRTAGGPPQFVLTWEIGYLRETGEYFDRATLPDGTPLPTRPATEHVVACAESHALCDAREELSVTLSHDQIMAAAKSGLEVRLHAWDNLTRTVYFSKPYVQGSWMHCRRARLHPSSGVLIYNESSVTNENQDESLAESANAVVYGVVLVWLQFSVQEARDVPR